MKEVQLYPEVSVRVSCRLHTVVPERAEPKVCQQNERCEKCFERKRKWVTTRWTFDWILTKSLGAVLQEEEVGLTGRVESL